MPERNTLGGLEAIMDETITARHIALLASVPSKHLDSAAEKLKQVPRVAFSTKMADVFAELELERKKLPVDVFLYASHPDGGFEPVVSWRAKYVGITDKEGAKPYRPDTTASDTYDGEIFWLVEDLRKLEKRERVEVTKFTGYQKAPGKTKKPYGKAFRPHRPLLVEYPLL
jgi:hypothetical protein